MMSLAHVARRQLIAGTYAQSTRCKYSFFLGAQPKRLCAPASKLHHPVAPPDTLY